MTMIFGELTIDRPVASICQSGRLDAHNVSGGITAWEQRGLDTSTPGRTR